MDVDVILDEADDTEDEFSTGSNMESSGGRHAVNLPRSSTFRQVTIRRLQHRMKKIVRWDRMVSCVSISGKVRYNAYQYSYYVRSLRKINPSLQLRTYRAVTGQFWKKILRYGLPASEIYHLRQTPRSGTADVRVVKKMKDTNTHPNAYAWSSHPNGLVWTSRAISSSGMCTIAHR